MSSLNALSTAALEKLLLCNYYKRTNCEVRYVAPKRFQMHIFFLKMDFLNIKLEFPKYPDLQLKWLKWFKFSHIILLKLESFIENEMKWKNYKISLFIQQFRFGFREQKICLQLFVDIFTRGTACFCGSVSRKPKCWRSNGSRS